MFAPDHGVRCARERIPVHRPHHALTRTDDGSGYGQLPIVLRTSRSHAEVPCAVPRVASEGLATELAHRRQVRALGSILTSTSKKFEQQLNDLY